MQDLKKLESDLWEAADQLRANSRLTAGEYSMPVLGLIFLRQATNRFYAIKQEIEAALPRRGGVPRPLTADDFTGKAALFLPEQARYDFLANLPGDADIGKALAEAMAAVEAQSAMLKDALPKEYAGFAPDLLRKLLRIFDSDTLRNATGDLFGRIYEYFLNKFAMTGAQEGGEFFTPPALVRLIVNMIEPHHGNVLDCAVGSAGMFVQTGYFLERLGKDPARSVVFHGQEKNDLTLRLALMNLAVHGLEGTIHKGNTFYDPLPGLVANCDFVMANPPFNVDMVDPERVKGDVRLPYGIPGISAKTGTVSNANYLWIQYFYSYLSEGGRAGFVMASSATDAGHGEKRIRQELVKTGDVDAIVAIGTNFFYTRSLPCTLWFFDKARPAPRQEPGLRDSVLMIDARGVYRVVTRKIRDFSDEQLQNLTAIAWLYHGEQERFLALVGGYLQRAHDLAAGLAAPLHSLDAPLDDLGGRLRAFADLLAAEAAGRVQGANGVTAEGAAAESVAPEGVAAEAVTALRQLAGELEAAAAALAGERAALLAELGGHLDWYAALDAAARGDNDIQHAAHDRFLPLAERLRAVQKRVHETVKLTERALAHAEREVGGRRHAAWDNAASRRAVETLAAARDAAAETGRQCLYFLAQAGWLQARFPSAQFRPVPGLCAAASYAEIEAHDGSLTPGRYVGVAAQESAEDGEFEERIQEIHLELADLNEEATTLAATIQQNFQELDLSVAIGRPA